MSTIEFIPRYEFFFFTNKNYVRFNRHLLCVRMNFLLKPFDLPGVNRQMLNILVCFPIPLCLFSSSVSAVGIIKGKPLQNYFFYTITVSFSRLFFKKIYIHIYTYMYILYTYVLSELG